MYVMDDVCGVSDRDVSGLCVMLSDLSMVVSNAAYAMGSAHSSACIEVRQCDKDLGHTIFMPYEASG